MFKPAAITYILGAMMLFAALLSRAIIPRMVDTSLLERPDLEKIIPRAFADWKIDTLSQLHLINPDTQGTENKIYDKTLVRTYINHAGNRIMLSIAYGSNQSTDLHVHRPEICYTAGGFSISDISNSLLDTSIGNIPAIRLVAKKGLRNEPITYWIRVGDSLTKGWLEQKFTAIGYGLTGKIPDGLLFRVSNISKNENESFHLQENFLSELLSAMQQQDRYWLIGRLSDAGIYNPDQ